MTHLVLPSFLVLVLLTPFTGAIHPDALQPFIDRGSTYSLMSFRLGDGEAADLQSRFLALATQSSTKSLEGIRVGVEQTGSAVEPPEWLLVDLLNDNDEVVTTVAFRNDNLYVVAGTNEENRWQCLAGREHLIDRCERLPFNGDYDAVHGLMLRDKIKKLELGRAALAQAARHFRGYGAQLNPTTVAHMKAAMATVAVMVSEATRFSEVRDFIRNSWEAGGFYQFPERFVYWARVSCEIAKGWLPTSKEAKNIALAFGITNDKTEAVKLLNMAIYARGCRKEFDAIQPTAA